MDSKTRNYIYVLYILGSRRTIAVPYHLHYYSLFVSPPTPLSPLQIHTIYYTTPHLSVLTAYISFIHITQILYSLDLNGNDYIISGIYHHSRAPVYEQANH